MKNYSVVQLFHVLPHLFGCLALWTTVRLHGKKLQNATNIISDPKKPIETLHVLQKLGKSVVPYICIWFITNSIYFSSPQDLYKMNLVGTFHKEPIISIVKVFGNATPFFTSIMQINALYV